MDLEKYGKKRRLRDGASSLTLYMPKDDAQVLKAAGINMSALCRDMISQAANKIRSGRKKDAPDAKKA